MAKKKIISLNIVKLILMTFPPKHLHFAPKSISFWTTKYFVLLKFAPPFGFLFVPKPVMQPPADFERLHPHWNSC